MAELTVSVAKAIAEGQGATAWEIYQLARAFLHEHGMESPPYVEPAALSHAAGQDGEQCRAASGEVVEALIEEVQGFANAYPEDVFPPLTDGERAENGHVIQRAAAAMGRHMAQRFLPKALALRALSRGVPEGMVLVPRASAEMAAVVCEEWGELFVGTPGFDKYERFNYGPAVEMLRDELRAIAAQRKEGQ